MTVAPQRDKTQTVPFETDKGRLKNIFQTASDLYI